MSLYLCPPTGTVAVHKLEEYATKRLQFLLRLVACTSDREVNDVLEDANVVDQSDCLITDTPKDTISHYILRLVLGGDSDTVSFFHESELALFKLRVERMLVEEWVVFCKSTDRFLCKLKGRNPASHNRALSDLMLVFDELKGKFESWNNFSSEICSRKNVCVSVNLPFQLVLRLVGGRQVDISNGIAKVPISLLKEVFIEQFDKLLVTATKKANLEREMALDDERIRRLAASLKSTLRAETKLPKHHPDHFHPLRLSDLWLNSFMFPPCMANMVKVLQEQHRLKHHDRIQLTLFLKELGLPLNDALLLWKREYSVSTNSSDIGHGWQGNERRYIYNIRHLYGLEGSRTDYKAHTCSAIQGRAVSCGHAGGCPFICEDSSALELMCNDHGLDKCSIGHISLLCDQKKYGLACQKFMIHKLEKINKNVEIALKDGKECTKIEICDSYKKPVAVFDNDIGIKVCHHEVSEKNEPWNMKQGLGSDTTMLSYGDISNSSETFELKYATNRSSIKEMVENKHNQRDITNLGGSLQTVDFKHILTSPWMHKIEDNDINIKAENGRFRDDHESGNILNNSNFQAICFSKHQHRCRLAADLTKLCSECTAHSPSSRTLSTINKTLLKSNIKDRKIYKQKMYLFKMKNKTSRTFPKRMGLKLDNSSRMSQSVSNERKIVYSNNQSLKYALEHRQTELFSRRGSSQQEVNSGRLKSFSVHEHSSFCSLKTGVDQIRLNSNSVLKLGFTESSIFSGAYLNSLDKVKNESFTFDAFLDCCGKSDHENNSLVELLNGSCRLLSHCTEDSKFSSKLSHCGEMNESSIKLLDCPKNISYSSNCSEISRSSFKLSHVEFCGQKFRLSHCADSSCHFAKLSHCDDVNKHATKLPHSTGASEQPIKIFHCSHNTCHFTKSLSHCDDVYEHTAVNSHQQKHERKETEIPNIEHTLQAIDHSLEDKSPGPTSCLLRPEPSWKHFVFSVCKCLECCLNEKTLEKSSFNSTSRNSFVIRKPKDIYWFCREHYK